MSARKFCVLLNDEELKFSTEKHLSDYGIINHSTIGVIFRLPESSRSVVDSEPDDSEIDVRRQLMDSDQDITEQRPQLRRLPGVVVLTNFLPDFADFDIRPDLFRAIMPCFHVMGSETMRDYAGSIVANGGTRFPCPYPLPPFLRDGCPAEWIYCLVRHVACFTTPEMHSIEKDMSINYIGKDSKVSYCPGCFTWCSRLNPKTSRIWCFVCSEKLGKDFIFCGHCCKEWKNTVKGGGCGNEDCDSEEAKLEILRNSKVTQMYGGTWPTTRVCPNCGILTEFLGQCSQMKCRVCGHCYCFLCLKGANRKADLKCVPYYSDCQRAPLQTTIPLWDGRINTGE